MEIVQTKYKSQSNLAPNTLPQLRYKSLRAYQSSTQLPQIKKVVLKKPVSIRTMQMPMPKESYAATVAEDLQMAIPCSLVT